MLTAQRKQLILSRLSTQGQIVAADLASELGISEDTVRRDLRELAQLGKLQRVHGGALQASVATGDLQIRSQVSSAEKRALACFGASLIRSGQVVFLDGGTTAMELARQLPADLRATIITHSPDVAVQLAVHPQVEIIVLGGRLFRHSMVHVGASVVEAASRFRADLFFLGITGVHPQAGLSTGDAEEADVKRALHAHAAETIVLASSEKLLRASAYVIGPMSVASMLVVPKETPAKTLTALRAGGAKVQKAV